MFKISSFIAFATSRDRARRQAANAASMAVGKDRAVAAFAPFAPVLDDPIRQSVFEAA
jgi:hypothetical protein